MQGKYLYLLTLCGLLLSGCKGPSEVTSTPPSSNEEPVVTPASDITLDGEKDELFNTSPVITFGVENRAQIQLFYGEKGLNFFAYVADDTPFAENDATWQNDSIEFYIDPLVDGQDLDGKAKKDDMQIRIDTRGVTEFYIGVRASDYSWTTSYFHLLKEVVRNTDHYIIEGFVGWYNFGFTSAPDKMAINFGHVDAEAFDYTWGGVSGEDNTNPTTWSIFNALGEKIVIDYFPETIFNDAYIFTNSSTEFPTVEIVFTEDDLYLKIHRHLTTRLADNNSAWWDGSQVTAIIDVAGDGGEVINNNDVKLVIRPTGEYAATIGPGSDNGWTPWLPGSWARNGVRNIKVAVDLNGNVPGEIPSAPYFTYIKIPFADLSLTKPASIRLFRFMGSESNPSTWQYVGSDGSFTEVSTDPVPNYIVLNDAYESTYAAAKYAKMRFAQDENFIYYSFTKIITKTTPGTDFWSDPDLTFFMLDTLGNGLNTPQSDDIKVFFVPNGYLGVTLGNGSTWNEPWRDGSWGINTVPGVDLVIDTTQFSVDSTMLVKVALAKTMLGISGNTTKIGMYDYSNAANENIPANYRIFNESLGKFID